MNILDRLKDSDDFTESEIEIATFILKNTDLVLHSSISKLAFYTYSSPATIVRFCKKLNCNGYKDFKLVLSCDFLNNVNAIKTTNFDLPFDSSDSTPAIARK